jgi:signal transduction histidine kinase/CheY-like chemotaxis protein
MYGTTPATPPEDRSRAALDFLHRLLASVSAEQPDLEGLLTDLTAAFAASGAGLARLGDGRLLLRHPAGRPAPAPPPWDDAAWRARVLSAPTTLTAALPEGGAILAAVVPSEDGWLLWLEDDRRAAWSAGESAALALAGQALARRREGEAGAAWAERLRRDGLQQRLEAAVPAVGRLAHDYGNVLTSVLGFVELSLAQPMPAHAPLAGYLREAHRAAQSGAELTQALRLFCRRQCLAPRASQLGPVLADEAARLRERGEAGLELRLALPDSLPPLALDPEQLRAVLAALLDNAREAVPARGPVAVSAAVVELSEADAAGLLGDARPGRHVEIRIRDHGPGLSEEARRRLWREPFYSGRSRRRGFGLAAVYGVLHAHRGGLALADAPGGGTEARVLAPAASVPALAAGEPARDGDKVLVVDDDPLVLQMVSTTLERAGFRVQAVASAEEALASYAAAAADPFRLVLSDVVMPRQSGWELARRLLSRDADAQMLFMSAQGAAPADGAARDLGRRFELLAKPFRPEGLLRAVRAALARRPPGRRGEGSAVASSR